MSICQKISQFLGRFKLSHRPTILIHWSMVLLYFNFKIHRPGLPGRRDTDFIFQYFKSRFLRFLKDEFYQFHSASWSWDTERQLLKSFQRTFLCSPLNALLISEMKPFSKYFKIVFYHLGWLTIISKKVLKLGLTIYDKPDKLSVSKKPHILYGCPCYCYRLLQFSLNCENNTRIFSFPLFSIVDTHT